MPISNKLQLPEHLAEATNHEVRGGRLTHGQMACPDCDHPIILPLEALLAGRAIFCSSCGISLQARVEDSAEAFSALRKARDLIDGLQTP